MNAPELRTGPDRRQNPRRPYDRYIFFATRKGFFEGELKDCSLNGLFIKSPVLLPVGEIITVALPYATRKSDKRKGQIIWRNREGFGVELYRDPKDRMNRSAFLRLQPTRNETRRRL